MMKSKRICIDLTNIIPGKGGSGGGITTYAIQYIQHLNDFVDLKNTTIYCIKHPQLNQLNNCNNIKMINYNYPGNFFMRFVWIQILLPLFCILHRINLLHRVTPEMPLIKVCKYICTLHDLMFDFYLNNHKLKKFLNNKEVSKFKLFKIITSHALNVSNRVIVPSETIRKELTSNYKIKEIKVQAIAEATVKNSQQKKTLDNVVHRELVKFIVVAGFYPHKGHLKIIHLATLLKEQGFLEFTIGFRGNPAYPNYIKEIQHQIDQNNLQNQIHFIPFTKTVNYSEIYSNYDIFLLLSEYEGFGLPVLEAQAFGLPVFCSDIPIFREVLKNSAFFVKNDINSMIVSNLLKQIKDKKFLNDLIEKGESNVKNYSWKKMSQQNFDLYNETLN